MNVRVIMIKFLILKGRSCGFSVTPFFSVNFPFIFMKIWVFCTLSLHHLNHSSFTLFYMNHTQVSICPKRKSAGVMVEWVSYRYCTPLAAAFWDGRTGLRAARFSGLHRRCKKDCSQLHHHNYCHCDRRLLQVGQSRIVKEYFESCVCACAATLDSSHCSPFIARGEQRTGEQASGSKAPEEIVY